MTASRSNGRPRLRTLDDVAAEMAKVYRAVKRQDVVPEVGTKLVYILVSLSKVLEVTQIERRIAALETQPDDV